MPVISIFFGIIIRMYFDDHPPELTSMISLTAIRVTGPKSLQLSFSDGSSGEWSADRILAKDTVLTRPLEIRNTSLALSSKGMRWLGRMGWSFRPVRCTGDWIKPARSFGRRLDGPCNGNA